MKRFLALALACIMIVACFAACNDGADDKTDGTTSGDTTAADTTTAAGDETSGDETTGDETTGDETTADITDETSTELVIDTSVFEGKRCATFGDSITWYDGQAYTWGKKQGEIAVGYQSHMREQLKLEVANCGYSGQTMPQIISNLISFGAAFKQIDYLTITSGANDERRNTPMGELKAKGSTFDKTTYIGSLQAGIEFALSQNPNLKIMLLTPIQGWIYAPAGYAYDYDKANSPTVDGIVTEKWADAIKEVAELYDLPVCDLYNESGIDSDDISDRQKYMNDPEPPQNTLYSLHPTAEGFKLMADVIIKDFVENFGQ